MTGENLNPCRLICPYVTYCDAAAAHSAARDEATTQRLMDHLQEMRGGDPNVQAAGFEPPHEIYPGEFSDFGSLIGMIGDIKDENNQKLVKLREGSARWLRAFCWLGPLQRKRFGVTGQDIIRCSSIVKLGLVYEERFLREIDAMQVAGEHPELEP